ncbi:hypothetical protein BEWA_032410 [Theileria equi strain WA]|uniref:Uncharacterized protein n=1 Tax=Theileria equi strain WA TaxID=1537102 RepID=L0AYT8_THEEQ|nr:hypothetical protein BEWA_032410 [Theileria equi strain WA]AFZ80388.1 hypothetical protein BEWA_032410 [Theileria equi strain WA]|eukprot:XP_004830054.1 hypothetical protein BEWA_032410 [Theileria equi strain WA]
MSVATFRDKNDQVGLPPVKGVSTIYVYFNSKNSRGIPLLITYQQDFGEKSWFRRNTKSGNTWSEVCQYERPTDPSDDSDNKIKGLLQHLGYYPSIIPDLSNLGNYSDESTDIGVTVRASFIEDGYSKFEHSLRGGLFELKGVIHGTGNTPLTGISSNYPIESVSAYYYGGADPQDMSKLLLVEFVIKNNQTTYKYYHKQNKEDLTWSEYSVPGQGTTQLRGTPLKEELDKLKKVQSPDHSPSIGQQILGFINSTPVKIGGGSLATGVGGSALGYGGYKLFISLIARL